MWKRTFERHCAALARVECSRSAKMERRANRGVDRSYSRPVSFLPRAWFQDERRAAGRVLLQRARWEREDNLRLARAEGACRALTDRDQRASL
jgi:hypothetical protein